MLINVKLKCLLGFVLVFFSGCSWLIPVQKNCAVEDAEAISIINIQEITDSIAFQLCGTNEESNHYFRPDEIVIVPDFVDIKSFRPESNGLILGEKFRTSVNRICKVPIRQVELNKDFRLSEDGLTALTRDVQAIRNPKAVVKTALVGTYTFQYNTLNLIAKKISIDNSVITDIASREIKWKCNISVNNKETVSWTIK
jgi:hypothetical protein